MKGQNSMEEYKCQPQPVWPIENHSLKRLSCLGFFILILCISCTQRNEETITKFVFVSGSGNSYDSLNNPQLGIKKYLEFSPGEEILMAKGSGYTIYEVSPPFCLDEFYKLEKCDSLEGKLNETFIGKAYDSLYRDGNTDFRPYNFFIYETSKKNRKVIIYYKHSAPKELDSLDDYLNRIFVTQKLMKIERFHVNEMLVEVQKQIFEKVPPPPPPPPQR